MSKLLFTGGCCLFLCLVAISPRAIAQEADPKEPKKWAEIASSITGDSATAKLEFAVGEFLKKLNQKQFAEAAADFESLVKTHWSDSFQIYLSKRMHRDVNAQDLRVSLKIAGSTNKQDAALQRLQGYLLFINKEDEKSVHERLEKAIKLDATNPVPFFIRGRCDRFWRISEYMSRRRFGGAFAEETASSIADISEAIRLNPNSACFYMVRAEYVGVFQSRKEGLDDVAAAAKLDHDPFDCSLMRGQIYSALHDEASALKEFNEAIDIYQRQMILNGRSNYVHYNQLIPADAPLANCYFYRGKSKAELKDYRGALDDFNAALQRSKYLNNEIYENRALIYIALKEYHAALADLNKAPSFFGQQERRAWCKLQLKDYAGALSEYDDVLKRYAEDSDALTGRGITRHRMGDNEGAMNDLNKAIELVGFFKAEPSLARGMLYMDMKDPQNAILDFDRVIDVDSANVGGHFQRGLANHALKRFSSAISDFDTVLKMEPDNVGAYFNRGLAQRGDEDYSAAIESFDAVIKRDPKHTRGYYFRGLTKHDNGDNVAALADYDQALSVDPKYANVYPQRAMAKILLNEFKPALADYDTAIQLDNNLLKAITGKSFLLSTCNDASLRDPQTASDLANRALEIDANEPFALNARACADAAAGNYSSAVALEEHALDSSRFADSNDVDGGQYALERIEAWRANKLWTTPAAAK